MRSALFCSLGYLVMVACSTGPASPAPSFGSPESAAAYLVLQPREREELGTVILNIPPGVGLSTATLQAELGPVADRVVLWRSDSLYGDPKRRAEMAHAEAYLILDMRRVAPTGADSVVLQVQEERCPGWPCHATHQVLVRREPMGFIPLTLKTFNID
jgi:hypothetical protein